MTEALLTYRCAVYPWHCDHVGHMNVMWYAGKWAPFVAGVLAKAQALIAAPAAA